MKKKKKMKTKNRLMAVVLCSLFLVTLAGIGIASATEDETLDIYGNANEDDIIDMRDLTFTARMILRLEDETDLADANYDGRISVADMTQIGLIILGRESKLTLVDESGRTVTVNKPVERVTISHPSSADAISLLGAWDRVVGRSGFMTDEILFPGITELPIICGATTCYDVYYEEVFDQDPDIFLAIYHDLPGFWDLIDNLEPEIPVVALNIGEPVTLVENTRKLRYVLNTEERGEEFLAWYEGVRDSIEAKTAGLSEDEKPQMFFEFPGFFPEQLCTVNDDMDALRYQIELAGGINIAADLPGPGGFVMDVDPEWLVDQNPDVVVAAIVSSFNPGAFGYDVDDTSVAEATREDVMAMDAFAGGKAVEVGRVYLYQCELPITPRFIVSIAYMAKWFHPELFSELDPQDIHQEYLTDFMCIDYDLSEHGVFAYPEP